MDTLILLYLGLTLIIAEDKKYLAENLVNNPIYKKWEKEWGVRKTWIIVSIFWNISVIFWPITYLIGIISTSKK